MSGAEKIRERATRLLALTLKAREDDNADLADGMGRR